MPNSFLKKIILEEIQNVLSEQGAVANRKIKDLQKHLASLGYSVGPIDGIAGPKLFKAIAKASGVPESQVAKDFQSSGTQAAENFMTALSGAVASDDVSAKPKGVDKFLQSKPREMGRMPNIKYSPKEGDRMKGELGTEVYHDGKWVPESEYSPK